MHKEKRVVHWLEVSRLLNTIGKGLEDDIGSVLKDFGIPHRLTSGTRRWLRFLWIDAYLVDAIQDTGYEELADLMIRHRGYHTAQYMGWSEESMKYFYLGLPTTVNRAGHAMTQSSNDLVRSIAISVPLSGYLYDYLKTTRYKDPESIIGKMGHEGVQSFLFACISASSTIRSTLELYRIDTVGTEGVNI